MRFATELRSIADKSNAEKKERAKERAREVLNSLEPKFVSAAEKGQTRLELTFDSESPFTSLCSAAEEILEDLGYKQVVVQTKYLYVEW